MPTAGRLAGAVVLGLFGFYFAGVATPFFNEGRPPPTFLTASVLIGIYLGWAYVGNRIGQGYIQGIGLGITTAVAFSVMNLFVIAFSIMIQQAMRMRYDGAMEGVVAVFTLMVTEGARFLDVTLIATLFVGSIICVWVAEYFGRKYP
ncbi:TrgA family protein [Yoonia sp.]|uniref:TrgA family protein n=1 Tax=Yoonia sp. TaxID=2212373 RepID=UPI003A4D74E0